MAAPGARSVAPSDDERWKLVETRMRRLGNRPEALIEALHATQEAFGHIDQDALRYIGATLNLPPSKVFGVATFYHYFRLMPTGKHTAVVCTGTACYIDGASELLQAVDEQLGVRPTDAGDDGRLSVLTARCIGACSLAPATIIDGRVHGRVTPAEFVARLGKL